MADNSSKKPTLVLKDISTFPLTVNIALPPEKPKIRGYITAHAVIRDRDEVKKLREDITGGEYDSDGAVLREMYDKLEGIATPQEPTVALEGDEAFDYVIEGKYNVYLIGALMAAYFEHFDEARAKNFGRSRVR